MVMEVNLAEDFEWIKVLVSELLAACKVELESIRGEQDKVTNIEFKISPVAVGILCHVGLSISNACFRTLQSSS